MKCIKKVIMGIAAVMAVSAIGAVPVSAQELTPVKADTVQTKASESITIEMNTESDKYAVVGAGSVMTDKNVIEHAVENNAPVKDENTKNDKASEGIAIDTNSESQEYSVCMMGSAEYNECPIMLCEAAKIIDVTAADDDVIIKSSANNDKLLISRDGGKTWEVSEMPEIAETAK